MSVSRYYCVWDAVNPLSTHKLHPKKERHTLFVGCRLKSWYVNTDYLFLDAAFFPKFVPSLDTTVVPPFVTALYMYICIYIYIHIYIYIYIYIYMYIYTCIYSYRYIFTCTNIYRVQMPLLYQHIYTSMYIYIYMHIFIYVYFHMYKYVPSPDATVVPTFVKVTNFV